MTTFQFIDNTSTSSQATRRKIRSHAATGKNLGRQLHRPSKIAALKAQPKRSPWPAPTIKSTCPTSLPPSDDDLKTYLLSTATNRTTANETSQELWNRVWSKHMSLAVERQLPGTSLPQLPFKTWLSPESEKLMQRATSFFLNIRYTPELRSGFNSVTTPSLWLKLMFSDEAYYHVAMAASMLLLSQSYDRSSNLVHSSESTTASMGHLSKTFQLINQRLTEAHSPSSNGSQGTAKTRRNTLLASDPTMAVVVMMAQYERHQGRFLQGMVHIRGLQRMVELRGGVKSLLSQNPILAHKLLRLDVEYALHLGATTHFSTDEVGNFPTVLGERHHRPLPEGMPWLSTELNHIFADCMNTSHLVNAACIGEVPKIDLNPFLHTLLVFGFKLVGIRPLGAVCWVVDRIHEQRQQVEVSDEAMTLERKEKEGLVLNELVHLGLLAWLIRFMHRLDGVIPEFPRLIELIQRAVEAVMGPLSDGDADGGHVTTKSSPVVDRRSAQVVLWALFLTGAIQFQRLPYEPWLLRRIKQTICIVEDNGKTTGAQMGRRGWENSQRPLEKFPWVDNLHGREAEKLYLDAANNQY